MKSRKVLPSATEPWSWFKLLVSVWLLLFALPTQPVPGREETWPVDRRVCPSKQGVNWGRLQQHFPLSGISFCFMWGRQDKHSHRSVEVLGSWEQMSAALEKRACLDTDLAPDCCSWLFFLTCAPLLRTKALLSPSPSSSSAVSTSR